MNCLKFGGGLATLQSLTSASGLTLSLNSGHTTTLLPNSAKPNFVCPQPASGLSKQNYL